MRENRNISYKVALLSSCFLLPFMATAQDQEPDLDEDEVAVQDTIIVTGRRSADREALSEKRAANVQVDQIRSDDVGRLPDQNVAEAVGRLPGVSVANDQGEGRYLTVRGVSPDLLNVTINGQTAAAPEPESRQVKLDDIPSGLIGAVTVVKTLTPDRDANAIAGQADIETVSAFDKEGQFGNFSAAYGWNDISDGNPYEFDGSWGTKFGQDEQFGIVLAFNHSNREYSSENFQSGGSWDSVNGFDVPLEQTLRLYNIERERTGGVVNLDWRPSDTVRTYARVLYSEFSDNETRAGFTVELDEDEITNQTATTGDFAAGESERALRFRQEDSNTFTASFGGEFDIGENLLNVEGTYTRAEKNDPFRNEWVFVAEDLTGSYDLSDNQADYSLDAAAFDISNFEFDEFGVEARDSVEELFQAQVDYEHQIAFGDDSTFKVGAKYLDRDKRSNEDATIYDGFSSDITLDMFGGPDLGTLFDGRYALGRNVDLDSANAFFASNEAGFDVDPEGTLGDSLAADFEITEQITAAYAMATLVTGNWTIIPGVRFEHTSSDYAAKALLDTTTLAEIDKDFDTFGSQSYSDWFPSLNLRYDWGDSLVLRGSITRAIGRPNYEELAPITIVNTLDNEVELGNPDLEPRRSTNFDASVEYYIGETGIISAAIFHKEISDPIYFATFDETGIFAGQSLVDAEVTRPVNADEATVTGIEFNAQYELSFLPDPFDGFSLSGSLSLVDSEASGIPGRSDNLPLARQSDTVASAALSYEKHKITGRIAYTYRSENLLEPGEDTFSDIYVADFGQWDARVSYAVLSNVNVFLEGSNLNDEPFQLFQGVPERVDEIERYGVSTRLGVQVSF